MQAGSKKFQYPLRVEVGCNPRKGRKPFHHLQDSFPSPGRRGLQLASAFLDNYDRYEFQYPLRVEVGCNLSCVVVERGAFMFQYPLRVEVGCNGLGWAVNERKVHVSVPSTGRSGLQPVPVFFLSYANNGFSTLYGSKWVATRYSNGRQRR